MRLHGMISRPETHRSGTGAIYTFINGRYIRDRVVQHALLDGYRSVLEKGRYPIAVLFLDMPPEEVDVNVHPTKHEVRFREQSRVHAFLAGVVRQCLRPGQGVESRPSSVIAAFGATAKRLRPPRLRSIRTGWAYRKRCKAISAGCPPVYRPRLPFRFLPRQLLPPGGRATVFFAS